MYDTPVDDDDPAGRSPIRPAPLESARFGIRVVRGRVADRAAMEQALRDVESQSAELVILRVPAERLDVVQLLERHGYFLADTLVEFEGPVRPLPEGAASDVRVRTADPGDADALAALASAAFTDFTGHFHTTRLDPGLATEGYVEWCLAALDDPGHDVFLATREDALAGFLTARVAPAPVGEIVLNGVAPDHRRRGVYRCLVAATLERMTAAGLARVETSTQVHNVAPQRTWIEAGLRPCGAVHTLHGWRSPEARSSAR